MVIFASSINAQEIPKEFFFRVLYPSLINEENYFKHHSTLGPVRYSKMLFGRGDYFGKNKIKLNKSDSANFNYQLGLNIINDAISVYSFLHFTYKNKFFFYFYPRIVSDVEAFERYTGLARPRKRLGFNSGEVDISGVGYESDWLLIQFGRGRQVWAAGSDLGIVLDETSPSYDHFLISGKVGRFRSKYFHGFLENIQNRNRYISGRGLEWSNDSSLIISLSEISIYSGIDRPFDISYLNPMTSHLEIELNGRGNNLDISNGNAVWQAAMDYRTSNNLLLSLNIVIDEITLDRIDSLKEKDNGLGFSSRISWTTLIKNKYKLNYNGTIRYVSTHNLRHVNGFNNFVHRNKPLGYKYGSDYIEYGLGINFFNMTNTLLKININAYEIGENSIIKSPYNSNENYFKESFPSGETTSKVALELLCIYKLNQNYKFTSQLEVSDLYSENIGLAMKVGINIFYNNN